MEFINIQNLLLNELINKVNDLKTYTNTPITKLVLDIHTDHDYGISFKFETINDNTQTTSFNDLRCLNDDIHEYFKQNENLTDFFGSIIYHIYDATMPLPEGYYDELGLEMQNGILEAESLPEDLQLFLEETAIYCVNKLKDNINGLNLDENFKLYVVNDNNILHVI